MASARLDDSPSDAFRVVGVLQSPAMARRASAALRLILRNRGHGSIVELMAALGASRSTVDNWRSGTRYPPSPHQVWRIATAYAADPDGICDPDQVTPSLEVRDEIGHLFDLFYSDNPKAAVEWLEEHRPWTTADTAAA